MATAAAAVLLVAQSVLPVYLKALFDGVRGVPAFGWPLVVSALQVWLSDWASSDRTGDREALVADMIARLRLALVGPTA